MAKNESMNSTQIDKKGDKHLYSLERMLSMLYLKLVGVLSSQTLTMCLQASTVSKDRPHKGNWCQIVSVDQKSMMPMITL